MRHRVRSEGGIGCYWFSYVACILMDALQPHVEASGNLLFGL